MNVHVSYRLHKLPAVEKDIQHQIERLQKRLQVFRPELIHLKGVVEEISPREGTSVSLNLRLPSGQMAVQVSAASAAAAVKSAFEDLLQQVTSTRRFCAPRTSGSAASAATAPGPAWLCGKSHSNRRWQLSFHQQSPRTIFAPT